MEMIRGGQVIGFGVFFLCWLKGWLYLVMRRGFFARKCRKLNCDCGLHGVLVLCVQSVVGCDMKCVLICGDVCFD